MLSFSELLAEVQAKMARSGTYPSVQYDTPIPDELRRLPLPDDVGLWLEFLSTQRVEGSLFMHSLCPVSAMHDIADTVSEPEMLPIDQIKIRSGKLSDPNSWVGTRLCLTIGSSSSGHLIDLNPGPEGNVGQIIEYGESGNYQTVIFESLREMLEVFVMLPDGLTTHDVFADSLPHDFVCE